MKHNLGGMEKGDVFAATDGGYYYNYEKVR